MFLPAVSTDRRVLGFALAISLLTSLIFGLFPALESSRPTTSESLKEGRGNTGGRSQRAPNWFVAGQVALSLLLLVGSGLMIRSLMRLQSVDPGFDPKNVLTASISLPRARYTNSQQKIDFFQQLLTRTRQLPGVHSAAAGSGPPFAGIPAATGFTIAGRPAVAHTDEPVTHVRMVDQEYFRTLGIQLLNGRNFTEREVVKESHVVIINESLARQHFANQNPLGQRLTIEMKDKNDPCEVVGVVGDVKWSGLDVPSGAMIYWPQAELPDFPMMLVVKTDIDPSACRGTTREVLAIDREQPLSEIRMDSLMADSISRSRFATFLLGIFAVVALLLASWESMASCLMP